jgi:CRISPR-associated protein Csd2
VRAFGAVMSTTDFNCGQVRGPVQVTFARSFHRIYSAEHAITRVAYTTEAKTASTTASTEMGNKHTVAYGLYAAHGFVSPALGKQTGFSEEDLQLLWKSLINMLGAFDASASRGTMAARNLFVFEHASALGEAPAHKLFELVESRVRLRDGVETPRSYGDYIVPKVDEIRSSLPAGVNAQDKVNPE